MEELNSHRPEDRPPMEKEEVTAGPRVLDRVLDEVDDRVALEFSETSEAKVA